MHKSSVLLLILSVLLITGSVFAQSDPVPTLIPPTPLPIEPVQENEITATQSTLARIQETGTLRVGILYNEPPFARYTLRGEVDGYEASIARTLAETWDVEVEFVQVTRQNRLAMLLSGEVDVLMATVVQSRSLDERFEFSHIIHMTSQAVLTRAADELNSTAGLVGQPVGYVVGTDADIAFNQWLTDTGIPITPTPFLTLDNAYRALFGGQINAIVGRATHLRRVSAPNSEAVTILDEVIQPEPVAIVMLRGDAPLRNLINRTLQYLASDAPFNAQSTLEIIHQENLPGTKFPIDAIPIYANVGDAPKPNQFDTSLTPPTSYAVPRIQSSGALRVAGVTNNTDGLTESQRRLNESNRAIAERLAQRWGVAIQFVEGNPIDLVEQGQADIAMGIEPDWNNINRVDYSLPYFSHGDRLLVPSNRDFDTFSELRNRVVATINTDTGAAERAEGWAESVNRSIRSFQTSEANAYESVFDDSNADVIFGDSLLLVPILRSNPSELRFGPTTYSREYFVVATPRNDTDMRRLVDYTLQELYSENVLQTFLVPLTPPEEASIEMPIIPGGIQLFGFTIGS